MLYFFDPITICDYLDTISCYLSNLLWHSDSLAEPKTMNSELFFLRVVNTLV